MFSNAAILVRGRFAGRCFGTYCFNIGSGNPAAFVIPAVQHISQDVGDFVVMASTLVEIKSRQVLPRTIEETPEEQPISDDPSNELIQQLMEYKRYKDAALAMEQRAAEWQERYPRLAIDVPPRQRSLADEPIREIEMWDLVSAFGRIMQQHGHGPSQNIVYDDTPIEVHMDRIRDQLLREGRVAGVPGAGWNCAPAPLRARVTPYTVPPGLDDPRSGHAAASVRHF